MIAGIQKKHRPNRADAECTLVVKVPVTVAEVGSAVGVSDGGDHACAVLSTGQIKCWGENLEGEIGDGEVNNPFAVETPRSVSGIVNATDVSTSRNLSCAVLATGGVDCWGENVYEDEYDRGAGALGNGEEKGPEECQKDPDIYCSDRPVAVKGITNATEVSAVTRAKVVHPITEQASISQQLSPPTIV